MILPIYLYGQPVLRKKAKDIEQDYPNLEALVDNMYQTMYYSNGIGLAGPQIGLNKKIFVTDGTPMEEDYPELAGSKRVFINPEITSFSEETNLMEEGCLSLPDIHEKVPRSLSITMNYYDEQFIFHENQTFHGFCARMIQHEYEHLQGHVFTDNVQPSRRQIISNRLQKIAKGKVHCDYKVK